LFESERARRFRPAGSISSARETTDDPTVRQPRRPAGTDPSLPNREDRRSRASYRDSKTYYDDGPGSSNYRPASPHRPNL